MDALVKIKLIFYCFTISLQVNHYLLFSHNYAQPRHFVYDPSLYFVHIENLPQLALLFKVTLGYKQIVHMQDDDCYIP